MRPRLSVKAILHWNLKWQTTPLYSRNCQCRHMNSRIYTFKTSSTIFSKMHIGKDSPKHRPEKPMQWVKELVFGWLVSHFRRGGRGEACSSTESQVESSQDHTVNNEFQLLHWSYTVADRSELCWVIISMGARISKRDFWSHSQPSRITVLWTIDAW